MATQSLYRRYRPRRFDEVKGQDHVVQALRNAVAEGREGQAYLFSGPRGTGKTTSARILAKVLNCTNSQGGEPCCECESCLAVERGTSYDVHELDAASNNGVDAMRDLIEKASLGTPGRHKVYILDEVHMLSKAAEAALLKTLEEPPPHVVFVLATTDPQKMSDTIRSRTQHLQFHLLPADTLQEHVRWVAGDAGLDVTDEAIEQVLNQGGGSARDTLSALELVANTGGRGAETVPLDVFVEAMIEHDAGQALTMTAGAIGLGRDPRTLTEELIGYLRNGFLSIMAPELVQLPSGRVESLAEQARRLGAAGLVRGIEQLGEALTEMRHAPDPRVLLDVAVVRLTSDAAATDTAALAARLSKLEKQIADGVPASAPTAGAAPVAAPAAAPVVAEAPPVNPKTGRAALGGRARRAAPAEAAAPSPTLEAAQPAAADPVPAVEPSASAPPTTAPAAVPEPAATQQPADVEPTPAPATPAPASSGSKMSQATWDDTVRPALRGMARAVFAPAQFVTCTDTSLTLSLPNPIHREKCEQHRAAVEQALSEAAGGPITLDLAVGPDEGGQNRGSGADPGGGGGSNVAGTSGQGAALSSAGPGQSVAESDAGAAGSSASASASMSSGDAGNVAPLASGNAALAVDAAADAAPHVADVESAPAESPRQAAERKLAEAAANGTVPVDDAYEGAVPPIDVDVLPEDHEVDLSDLVDAPPETVKTPIDRLAEAFPGSEMIEETY